MVLDAGTHFSQGSAPWRVMIVDDEELVRTSLSDMVELAGYQVCGQAQDGYGATRLVNSTRPDIILMDIVMPDMNGVEALQIINTTHPTCALVLSAYCSPHLLEQVKGAGAQGYLMKPCRQADLIPAIETAIAQFERSRTAYEADRIALLFERAWAQMGSGGSLSAAVARALAGACQVLGHSPFAFLARRGTRLQVLAAQGLEDAARGTFLGPVAGPLGMALRRQAVCQYRLVGAPAHRTAVLSAPIPVSSACDGCLCLFAAADHRFTAREEQLVAVITRALAGLLHRVQGSQPRAWERWLLQRSGRARFGVRGC